MPEHDVQRAAHRTMGISLKLLPNHAETNQEVYTYIENLLEEAIQNTYGARTTILDIGNDDLLESPDNLYQIAKHEVDDIFYFEVTLPDDFEIPPESSPEDIDEFDGISDESEDIKISSTIYNGANLRTVGIFRFSVPTREKSQLENLLRERFDQGSMGIFSNPNAYPLSDPLHFANLLYSYSQEKEKDERERLSCDTVHEIYQHYGRAKELYDLAEKKGLHQENERQEAAHRLSTRKEESTQKADLIERCKTDSELDFEVTMNFDTISEQNQQYIQASFDQIDLETTLQQYTNKPVEFRFHLEPDGSLALSVHLRFHQNRFQAWTREKFPQVHEGYHIVALDPYYPLMQKLVMWREFLPEQAPRALRQSFKKMSINLVLATLLNGRVSFGVDGRYNREENRIQMAYPNSFHFSSPTFDRQKITTRSRDIFHEQGWLAFGNCETVDGRITEDGLILHFFGIPCQI